MKEKEAKERARKPKETAEETPQYHIIERAKLQQMKTLNPKP